MKWRWGQYVSPKFWSLPASPHGVTTQNIEVNAVLSSDIFIFLQIRNVSKTRKKMCFYELLTWHPFSPYYSLYLCGALNLLSSWIIHVFPDMSQSDGDSLLSSRKETFLVVCWGNFERQAEAFYLDSGQTNRSRGRQDKHWASRIQTRYFV
jgi:hypothetical protein